MSRSQLELLRAYGIKPVKRRGQNFLVDGNLARAIAEDILDIGPNVLELGAGGGALTGHLLAAADNVACVEVDRHLCGLLRTEFGADANFELIEADLARLDWPAVMAAAGDRPVLAGNLPYVLTSKVLFTLAELRDYVAGGVFMVQKEVAQRLVARPGGRDFGVLTVVLGSLFAIKMLRTVPRTVFWPRPEVESAVVRLLPQTAWTDEEFGIFVQVVKTLFGQRRKQIQTLLRQHYGLDAAQCADLCGAVGVRAEQRPEQIDLDQWRRLAAALAEMSPPGGSGVAGVDA